MLTRCNDHQTLTPVANGFPIDALCTALLKYKLGVAESNVILARISKSADSARVQSKTTKTL